MPCSLPLGLCVQVEMETKEQQLQKEKVKHTLSLGAPKVLYLSRVELFSVGAWHLSH